MTTIYEVVKMTKMKAKKSVKSARTKSAGQIEARRIGCPGVDMFQLVQLEPAVYNPRVITDEALEGLTNSISRFGCVEPVVVNTRGRNNVIVGGNQRFKALRSLGVTECLCVTISCSKADEKLLNLTLNNPQIQGDFVKKIAEYIERLRQQLPDDNDSLNLRIAELQMELGPGKTGRIPDDDIPKTHKKAKTRPGDLWLLGKHRLLCGDSTKEHNVSRLMNGKKASLFATDPPYSIDYTGDDRPKAGKDWSETFHDIDIDKAKKFMKDFFSAGIKYLKKNTALYLWHASKRRRDIEDVCSELGILIHQQIIWEKPCATMTYSFFMWQHEPCLLMWVKGNKPIWRAHKIDGKQLGTVWPIGYIRSGDPTTQEYYTDVWPLDYDGKKRPAGIEHPTVKPVEIFAIPMRVHTKTGDICYEPFCGSGPQIIAAEKLDRRCFAIEKEPVFVDVAVKRWEQWTGKKAKLANRKK
ncbi:hypothetical protein ES703_29969 [subsurface metagenome]